jgi:hypothetical protein
MLICQLLYSGGGKVWMSQQFPQQARGFHWRNIRIFDKIFSESYKYPGRNAKIPGSFEPGIVVSCTNLPDFPVIP